LISVLVCTYKRPILLKNCIESILNQITTYHYEIIVCDNDIEETAKDVVSDFSNIFYYVQPAKGLANIRNFAISKSNSEFILFIDDDEYASPNWISSMMQCQLNFNADVVLGGLVYEVPENFPSYIKKSCHFKPRIRLDGKRAKLNDGYTGNTLVKRDLFLLRTPPFQVKFNFVGGEDTDFFNFLLKNNKIIVFSEFSIIFEVQDKNRLNLFWFFRRGLLGGKSYARSIYEEKELFQFIYIYLKSIFGGICVTSLYFFLFLILPNKYLLNLISKFGNQIGKMSFWFNYKFKNY
jgi:succinoglycan biosynthesis protein ExoM